METETLVLACTAAFTKLNGERQSRDKDNLWKNCIWTRDSDGAACTQSANDALNIGIGQCDSSMKDVDFGSGNRQECKLIIPSIDLSHRGNWTCRIEKCKDISKGGCSSKGSSDCVGEATVHVMVWYYITTTMALYDNLD